MRLVAWALLCACVGLAGCESHRAGPVRPITIEDDVALAKEMLNYNLARFSLADPLTQASLRNQIITARMYIADVEYHLYESNLTRELQDEGLVATATQLGLTTAATLVPVAQTKTLLSGLATAVTGLDKAYNEKELLSHTIQALQTQMRADRKTEAGVIYAKMYKDIGNTRTYTPIAEYTLAMALSDADAYYQAGTLASAIVGVSRTVANAEQTADQQKSLAGPNPNAVAAVKAASLPQAAPVVPPRVFLRIARTPSVKSLRDLLLPNGAKKPDPAMLAYVKQLLGNPNVVIGPILVDPELETLRQRLAACIIARNSGSPCAPGSLADLIQK